MNSRGKPTTALYYASAGTGQHRAVQTIPATLCNAVLAMVGLNIELKKQTFDPIVWSDYLLERKRCTGMKTPQWNAVSIVPITIQHRISLQCYWTNVKPVSCFLRINRKNFKIQLKIQFSLKRRTKQAYFQSIPKFPAFQAKLVSIVDGYFRMFRVQSDSLVFKAVYDRKIFRRVETLFGDWLGRKRRTLDLSSDSSCSRVPR